MSQSQADSSATGHEAKKRKAMESRSVVWDHFEKKLDPDGNLIKGKCNYCGKMYAAIPKKHGTTSLKNHSNVCIKNTHLKETKQTMLAFSKHGDVSTLTSWVFNQERVRKALCRMIIMDELAFKFVEGRGFKEFVEEACPQFKIPSRWTVNRDVFGMFFEERMNLKKYFTQNSQWVSLTTDTWTSIQRINYMCITAHYIDEGWNLNKKIISFVPIQSHRGDAIAKAMEVCLVEWGIKNIVTIMVDNASNNDTALAFLTKKLVSWGCSSVRAQYLHMRYVAHILNLVVQDGLKMADSAIKKLIDNVRWVRGSPARLTKFRDLATLLGVEEKSSLCLDVPTRWNSTFMMLRTVIPYKTVFESYDGHDTSFWSDLGDSILDEYDWDYIESFVPLLKHFYEIIIRIPGSLYVTAISYLSEIVDLSDTIEEMTKSQNFTEKNMGEKMMEKFNKYWGDPEKMNTMIFFASILDPRYKMEYMPFQINQLFGEERGEAFFSNLKSKLTTLFEAYVAIFSNSTSAPPYHSQSESQSQPEKSKLIGQPQSKFIGKIKKQKQEMGVLDNKKTELEIYLGESIVDDNGLEFDILIWWKNNSARFLILSKLARDILVVPISTVASEATFSTSGRVLDSFRSSLIPKIVEALICTQDWLRGLKQPVSLEENLDDLEKFEEEMANLKVGSSNTVDVSGGGEGVGVGEASISKDRDRRLGEDFIA